MGIFKFFKKRPSQKILVSREYREDWGFYTFPTDKGDVTIRAIVHESSKGEKTVLYERIGEWLPERTSEDVFVKDIFQIVRLVSNGRTNEEVMDVLLGNLPYSGVFILDSDVLKYISELSLVLVSMYGNCDKDDLLQRMMQYAENNYQIKYLFAEFKNKRKRLYQ